MTNLNRYAKVLATLTQADIDAITRLIKQGWGAHGIKCENLYSLRQINAVFALVSAEQLEDPNYVGSRHHY
jgi:hypothetical protein